MILEKTIQTQTYYKQNHEELIERYNSAMPNRKI